VPHVVCLNAGYSAGCDIQMLQNSKRKSQKKDKKKEIIEIAVG